MFTIKRFLNRFRDELTKIRNQSNINQRLINFYLLKIETYNMKPFHGLKISFLGFSDEDSEHMNEITLQNGNIFHLNDLFLFLLRAFDWFTIIVKNTKAVAF